MHIYPINGACHRVASDATAFAYRDATLRHGDRRNVARPRGQREEHEVGQGLLRGARPHSLPAGYVNFMADDDARRVRENYRGNWDRLVSIKRTYDPDNLFHLNQNIRP